MWNMEIKTDVHVQSAPFQVYLMADGGKVGMTRIDNECNTAVHIPKDRNAHGTNTYLTWFDTDNVRKLQRELDGA
jgi:hypothetical protein